MFAKAKGRSIGVIRPRDDDGPARSEKKKKLGEFKQITILGRKIAVRETEDGLRYECAQSSMASFVVQLQCPRYEWQANQCQHSAQVLRDVIRRQVSQSPLDVLTLLIQTR